MFLNPQADPVLLPTIVGSLVLIPEVFILLTKFTRSRATFGGDSYSLLSIMGTIFVSICLAVSVFIQGAWLNRVPSLLPQLLSRGDEGNRDRHHRIIA